MRGPSRQTAAIFNHADERGGEIAGDHMHLVPLRAPPIGCTRRRSQMPPAPLGYVTTDKNISARAVSQCLFTGHLWQLAQFEDRIRRQSSLPTSERSRLPVSRGRPTTGMPRPISPRSAPEC